MAEVKTETATKAKKTSTSTPKAAASKIAKTVAEKPAKVAAVKAAPKKAATAKTTTKRVSKAKNPGKVSPEQRYLMICEAAYYKAERRGFSPENEIQDWIEAEAEINRMLGM